jgi:hypothetical protein
MERIREMKEMRSTQTAPTNPINPPHPTRNMADFVVLIQVVGWVFSNTLVLGQVAKKAKTRPN